MCDDAEPRERPVYGVLDFRRQVVGTAPRFGSSRFRLTAGAPHRAAFCHPAHGRPAAPGGRTAATGTPTA